MDPVEWGPLVFRLRDLRLTAGSDGLTQAELASLAGVSPRAVRNYEYCRALPPNIACFVSLAAALNVPLEWLIAQKLLTEIRGRVETRRAILLAGKRRSAEVDADELDRKRDLGDAA